MPALPIDALPDRRRGWAPTRRAANHTCPFGKVKGQAVIVRIWHMRTAPGNADRYEALLKEEIFVGTQHRQIQGFQSIRLPRRGIGPEVEFVTLMGFDSLEAVRDSCREDYEVAVMPESARAILARFDLRAAADRRRRATRRN